MSQVVNLNTNTTFNINENNIVNIKTSYQRDLPTLIQIQIMDLPGNLGGIPYLPGEVMVMLKNNSISIYINDLGELILIGNNEVLDYYIDINGNLIYQN